MADKRDDGRPGLAVGIDLGTTNSVIACRRGGQIEVVPSEEGHLLHPSVVGFKPSGKTVVGLKARLRRVVDPLNTVFSAKRLIGRPFSAADTQATIARLPYAVEGGPNDEPFVVTRKQRVSIIEISSMVLAHLKERAESHFGQPVTHCVITVPANFSDGQRAATRRAAEAAGFEVLRIINEPTAAALAYGLGRSLDQRVVVFDMGGGTFDATVLAIQNDLFEVISTGGDPYLGGDDMDAELATQFARKFLELHRIDISEHRHAVAKTIIAAEQVKMRLSETDVVDGSISELDHGEGGVALGLEFQVSREHFERLIASLVARAMLVTERVLGDAGFVPQLVDEVILVGGATRVPLVRRRVAELFGREPRADVNPMLAVAMGAAIQAEVLMGGAAAGPEAPLLMDVASHSLGVATAGLYTDQLIERNTPIPVDRSRVFSTSHDNQTRVDIRVCQGEDKLFANNLELGVVQLEGLPPAPRGTTRIEVSFLLDADGILQVTARDLATGILQRARLRVRGIGSEPRDFR